MTTFLQFCLIVLVVGLPFYFLYWYLFRPVLLTRLSYHLFKARDDLRLLVLRGDVGENDKAYPLLDRCCNRSIATMGLFDMTDFMATKLTKTVILEAERDLEVINSSSPVLRGIFRDIILASFGGAFANSPGVLMLLAPFVVFVVALFWFNRARSIFYRIFTRAWGFINLQPPIGCRA